MAGTACVSRAGTLKHHPRGVAHAERSVSTHPVSLIWVHGTAAELEQGFPRQVADLDGHLLHLMRWISRLDLGRADDRLLAGRIFAALLAACRRTPPADPLVDTVRSFVREHLADPLTLEGLAHAAGLSPFHFARRFRAATGLSPMAYVRRERVEAARRMVADTPMPLREIAPLTGFRDEFHLSRSFRRVAGVPAGRFRNR
jgi:AraC family transcriptional regulator